MEKSKKLSPLEFARAVFEDEGNPTGLRLRAAVEIVPYLEALLAPDGQYVSDDRRRAAEDAKMDIAKVKAFIKRHERLR